MFSSTNFSFKVILVTKKFPSLLHAFRGKEADQADPLTLQLDCENSWFPSLLGMFHEEECLRLSDRNSILMT